MTRAICGARALKYTAVGLGNLGYYICQGRSALDCLPLYMSLTRGASAIEGKSPRGSEEAPPSKCVVRARQNHMSYISTALPRYHIERAEATYLAKVQVGLARSSRRNNPRDAFSASRCPLFLDPRSRVLPGHEVRGERASPVPLYGTVHLEDCGSEIDGEYAPRLP